MHTIRWLEEREIRAEEREKLKLKTKQLRRRKEKREQMIVDDSS